MLSAFSVHLVELEGTGQYFAMKAMDKGVMLNRNKVLSSIKTIINWSIYVHGFLITSKLLL